MPKSRTDSARSSVSITPASTAPMGDERKVRPARAVPTKMLTLIAMLRRPDGATIADLVDATGWKPNSIRGEISGSIKKKRLMKVLTETVNGVRIYRIVG